MVLQTASTPIAQVVGNAFVEQYYHILHHSPELVYRFYHDSSVRSQPNANGEMISVTTMKGINEKILFLDSKNCRAEIKTVDVQNSHMGGLSVLVTGCLTGKDNMRRKFVQSFFLAPQDQGYFVRNDIFRYVEDSEVLETPQQFPHSQIQAKVTKGGPGPTGVYVATNTAKLTPKKTENKSFGSASPSLQSDIPAPVDTDLPETSKAQEEVKGHSICIRNLPLYTKIAELEAELKKFGAIKERGIEVRNSKVYCLGFVEFLSSASVDKAIQASPITIGGQEAVIERKKTIQAGSVRGRYPPEREKIRIVNIRGRGNYGGGRSFEGNFSGRDGASSGQSTAEQ